MYVVFPLTYRYIVFLRNIVNKTYPTLLLIGHGLNLEVELLEVDRQHLVLILQHLRGVLINSIEKMDFGSCAVLINVDKEASLNVIFRQPYCL